MVTRREFLNGLAGGVIAVAPGTMRLANGEDQRAAVAPIDLSAGEEDVFQYILRTVGSHSAERFAQILGAANEYKEGDEAVGVVAAGEADRQAARALLSRTRLADIDRHALHQDQLFRFADAARISGPEDQTASWTLGRLKEFLLTAEEEAIKAVMQSLSSDVIGCVVKLMSNAELIQVGRKVFNPLPGSQIGARGYMGARVQPNSPTDNVDDIRWQPFRMPSVMFCWERILYPVIRSRWPPSNGHCRIC